MSYFSYFHTRSIFFLKEMHTGHFVWTWWRGVQVEQNPKWSEVCLKIELSFWKQTFSSNSDCDNTGVYHICETNCLDRYFLNSDGKYTVGGIMVTCEYLYLFVFVFVFLNSDKYMMGGIMVMCEYLLWLVQAMVPSGGISKHDWGQRFHHELKVFLYFQSKSIQTICIIVIWSFSLYQCNVGVVAATVCLTPSILRT